MNRDLRVQAPTHHHHKRGINPAGIMLIHPQGELVNGSCRDSLKNAVKSSCIDKKRKRQVSRSNPITVLSVLLHTGAGRR